MKVKYVGVFFGMISWLSLFFLACQSLELIDGTHSDEVNFFLGLCGVGLSVLAGLVLSKSLEFIYEE
jgi:hypothetical protein